jgi:hypothetical protein
MKKGLLKKGDKVRIKSLKWYDENKRVYYGVDNGVHTEGNTFVSDMKIYCGQEAIITEYLSDQAFRIDLDDNQWWWTIGMVESINSPRDKCHHDIFKFGELFVIVDQNTKTIYPEFFSSSDDAKDYIMKKEGI